MYRMFLEILRSSADEQTALFSATAADLETRAEMVDDGHAAGRVGILDAKQARIALLGKRHVEGAGALGALEENDGRVKRGTVEQRRPRIMRGKPALTPRERILLTVWTRPASVTAKVWPGIEAG